MKKYLYVFLSVLLVCVVIYTAGPRPEKPVYDTTLPTISNNAGEVEKRIEENNRAHTYKPGNASRIVWSDPVNKTKTKVAVLYLHGFSASTREGFPTHIKFAEKYGCNLYLPILSDHGIDTTDAMYQLTVDRLWNSAKEAYAIAKTLGDEVLIMSTSTGGTLALKLAATYPEIKGLINFSPNIEINDNTAFLLNKPWGLQIARKVFKGNFRTVEGNDEYKKYWYTKYRLESLVALQQLLSTAAVPSVFREVKCPVFNGVYYRDEENHDPVVRVSAVRKMHKKLGTPETEKRYVEFPNANVHIIACDLRSKSLPEVFQEISTFAEEVLQMEKVQ